MNLILSSGNGRCSIVVSAIKAYTVLGHLVLVLLMRGLGLDGPTGLVLVELGYGLACFALVVFGFQALSSEQRGLARSNFVFAGVALLWLAVFLFLLPSLASA
jgi:hypothetical protein